MERTREVGQSGVVVEVERRRVEVWGGRRRLIRRDFGGTVKAAVENGTEWNGVGRADGGGLGLGKNIIFSWCYYFIILDTSSSASSPNLFIIMYPSGYLLLVQCTVFSRLIRPSEKDK